MSAMEAVLMPGTLRRFRLLSFILLPFEVRPDRSDGHRGGGNGTRRMREDKT